MPTSTLFSKRVRYTGSAQATGRKPTQEDALAVALLPTMVGQRAYLLLVADGVGGAQAGELASSIAASEVQRQLLAQPLAVANAGIALREAVQAAGRAILNRSYDHVDWRGMSSTCTAALLLDDGRLALAHVGDSRAYYCDRDGRLTQLTIEHTWAQEAIEAGRSAEELRHHPNAGVITRFLGVDPEVRIDTRAQAPGGATLANATLVDTAVTPLTLRGGQLFLCSDGVSGALSAAQMAATLRAYPAQQAAEQLVALPSRAGASDNLTAVVYDLDHKSRARRPLPAWLRWAAAAVAALLVIGLLWSLFRPRQTATPVSGGLAGVTVGGAAPPRQPTVTLAPLAKLAATATLAELGQATATVEATSTSAPLVTVAATIASPLGGATADAPSATAIAPGGGSGLPGEMLPMLVHPQPDDSVKTDHFELDWDYRSLGGNEAFQVQVYWENTPSAVVLKENRESFVTMRVSAMERGKYFWRVLVRRQAADQQWTTVAASEWWSFWAVGPAGERGPTVTPLTTLTVVAAPTFGINPGAPTMGPVTVAPTNAPEPTALPTVEPAPDTPSPATVAPAPTEAPPTKTPWFATRTPRPTRTPWPTRPPRSNGSMAH